MSQVLDRYEDDDDVAGIPEEFIAKYFDRAVKTPVNYIERETVDLQVSIIAGNYYGRR